jgi:hypothetical protein
MGKRLLRRDFVSTDTVCSKLSTDNREHKLYSGKAWVIEINGVLGKYGPNCAAAIFGHSQFREAKRMAPDLTVHDLTEYDEAEEGAGGGASSQPGVVASDHDDNARRYRDAAQYLELRMGALASIPGINASVRGYGALIDLYKDYCAIRSLAPAKVDSIHQIETGAKNKAWLLCRKNLLDVYAAYHQLLRQQKQLRSKVVQMKKKPWKDQEAHRRRVTWLQSRLTMVDSVTVQLLRKLYITPKQIEMLDLKLPKGAFPPERCQSQTQSSIGVTR